MLSVWLLSQLVFTGLSTLYTAIRGDWWSTAETCTLLVVSGGIANAVWDLLQHKLIERRVALGAPRGPPPHPDVVFAGIHRGYDTYISRDGITRPRGELINTDRDFRVLERETGRILRPRRRQRVAVPSDEAAHGISADAMECVACMEHQRATINMPCGHVALCHSCARHPSNTARCSLCRKRVDTRTPIYIA